MITILLADDHELVRHAVQLLLKYTPGIKIVAEAQDGYSAYEAVLHHHPDILILDIGMPGMNGFDLLKKMKENHLSTQVVILSMYSDETTVIKAFQNGAWGYVIKETAVGDLVDAIFTVNHQQKYLAPKLAQRMDLKTIDLCLG